MGALVIDVGQLYQERAELQNGADAAALGVAKSCALGTCDPSVATSYADANASAADRRHRPSGPGLRLRGPGELPGQHGRHDRLPAAPPAGTNYVDVHTATQTASGSTLLPPAFARTLLGNSGYQGTTVAACAQAEWGAPAAATTVAVTISACEWDQATSRAPRSRHPRRTRRTRCRRPRSTRCSGCTGASGTAARTEPARRGRRRHLRLDCSIPGNCSLAHQRQQFLPGPHPAVACLRCWHHCAG